MTAEDIIRIADERTNHLSSNDIETAHLCSLYAVVATLQETGITIDPIRQPDKELTARCYKNFKGYTVVSIPMGSREEQVKCHTPYIVQVRRQGGSRWETHIDTVIESNMTDCDSLCVCPSDGEDDAMYNVRILCAASSRWEEVQQEQKRRRIKANDFSPENLALIAQSMNTLQPYLSPTSVEALTGDPPLPDTLTINGITYIKKKEQ